MNRIRHLLTIVTVGLAVLALASPASADLWPGSRAEAEDWPQRFLDSRHQASTLVDPNIDVGDVNPLKVDWSVTDPGPRVADAETSPIVVGDAVYVGGKSITRYDRGSGDIVWRTPLGGCPRRIGCEHESRLRPWCHRGDRVRALAFVHLGRRGHGWISLVRELSRRLSHRLRCTRRTVHCP